MYYTSKCYFTNDFIAFSVERMYWQQRPGNKAWFHMPGKCKRSGISLFPENRKRSGISLFPDQSQILPTHEKTNHRLSGMIRHKSVKSGAFLFRVPDLCDVRRFFRHIAWFSNVGKIPDNLPTYENTKS